MFTIITA